MIINKNYEIQNFKINKDKKRIRVDRSNSRERKKRKKGKYIMILYNSENNNKEKILSNEIKKTYCNKEIDYDVNIMKMKVLIFFNLYSTSIHIFSLSLFSLLSFTNCNTILIILFLSFSLLYYDVLCSVFHLLIVVFHNLRV